MLKFSSLQYEVLFPNYLLERKSNLFSLVLISIVGILALPIIIPHFLHGYHVVHIFLHVGGISLAVFLTILAVTAYSRLRTKRLLITSLAFGVFIIAESVLLVEATWPTIYDIGLLPLLEVGHLLTFTTLGLLAVGVFRND